MPQLRVRLAAVATLVALAACYSNHVGPPLDTIDGAASDGAALAPTPLDPAVADDIDHAALVAALDGGEARNVLVVLDEVRSAAPFVTARTSDVRSRVLAQVDARDVLFAGRALPIVAVRVRDRFALAALERTRGVLRVEPEQQLEASTWNLDAIHQPEALARGAGGQGYGVAILDTGADFTSPDLGSCSAAGATCAVAYAHDFAPEDGVRDDSVRHGTNVASIVHSVAPSARILALDVFTGSGASSIDTAAALDWVISNRDAYGIVSVNMSLGHGGFTSPCPADALAVAVQRVRDAGIVSAIATGNSGYTNAISSPACAPAAVAVGAVDSSGTVASFSNSATFATLLAPGVYIAGGGVTMSGTSQATPHVAGAFAALRTAYPSDSASDAIARLVGTGVRITDTRNGIALPRVDLGAATVGGATAPPPDVTAPTGTLGVDGPWVRTTAVAYSLTASDPSGVASMCLGTATTCTAFVPYVATGTVTVPSGDGAKTVRAWLRDGVGNTPLTPLTATTTLDATKPVTGALTATAGIGTVTLSVATSTDAGSGLAGYRAVFSTGTAPPATCATGTALGDSAVPSFTHSGLVNGTTYRYRVCALDRAGNVGTGTTTTALPVAERDAPTGTIVLNGGATWAHSTAATATLTASDASAVTSVCFSATTTCTAWTAFAATKPVTLASGSGTRTVNAWFRDTWGNVSASPASDSIELDTVAPTAVATVSVARSDGALSLSWSASTDALSGIDHYALAWQAGTTVASCTSGTVVAVPAATGTVSATLGGLVNGRAYAFRVCAVDVAGNVGNGGTGSATPAPELVPPTGSIVVSSGATWTKSRSVTVGVAATDASGVAQMCVTAAATCTAWVTYASTAPVTLAATQGPQTVRAWFRDVYGNTTATPAIDDISLDTVVPTAPVVTATARTGGVDLAIGGSTDTGSGVAYYELVSAPGTTAPTSCATASPIAEATPRIASIGATTSVGWRVCAVDVAGNVSTGASGVTLPR